MRLIAAVGIAVMLGTASTGNAQTTKAKPVASQTITYAKIPDTEVMTSTAMAEWVKNNTSNQTEALRAIYAWIGKNVVYDTRNTYDPQYYKDTTDAALKTLRTRQAICYGYSSLFVEIARKAGISAMLVSGYTVSGSQLSADGSHAWVAVNVGDKWSLIDPTWAAGGVSGNKFYPSFTWKYFMVAPDVYIKTHVPFDPMYQFLEHPHTHTAIKENNWTDAAARPVFAFADTIAAWNRLDSTARLENAVDRIRRFGVSNMYVSTELSYMIQVLDVGRQNAKVAAHNAMADKFNATTGKYNELVNDFNAYVVFKNKQFTPAKPDKEIREWIDTMAANVDNITTALNEIVFDGGSNNARSVNEAKRSAKDMKDRIAEEQAFVTKYLKTGKLFRKSLFYKMTWMGIPVN
ncbi:Transglutaminase-like superfamily protein [Chitinophaga jiangningensis]|uniref:Transglutaminase-like superfamily protein n=1 Tax=Chitinophaga jiangningensis TaxID=1419482 RepID=A0A1M7FWV3_9BACT|nr:transglutaminase domain-containing protein [Chitinophaga jiangningensis]SHM08534.1 Transglutaminase-like superfamily protein [Chitinophaga jiangningensis]